MIWVIGVGGSLGAASRYILGNLIGGKTQNPFPLGTWIINISGSFLLGLLIQLHFENQISEWIWLFGGVGFCGAYTTFSTFGHEAVNLILLRKYKTAILYVVTSIIVGIISAAIGFYIIANW